MEERHQRLMRTGTRRLVAQPDAAGLQFRQRGVEPLPDGGDRGVGGIFDEDRELVSAEAGGGIAGAQVAVQTVSRVHEQRVAGRVAEAVAPEIAAQEGLFRRLPAAPFEPPPSLRGERMCALSYKRPVDGCPTYVEYFKDGDDTPTDLCPLHEGTFRQEAARAIDDVFRAIRRGIVEAKQA